MYAFSCHHVVEGWWLHTCASKLGNLRPLRAVVDLSRAPDWALTGAMIGAFNLHIRRICNICLNCSFFGIKRTHMHIELV
jgi:hypothetical protein